MNLFLQIKKFYQSNKNKPVLGKVLVYLKNFAYKHKGIMPQIFFQQELETARDFLATIFEAKSVDDCLKAITAKQVIKNNFSFGHAGNFDTVMLYAVTRLMKPDIVVETGVASGRSSTAILEALEENHKGHLYSIDLPQYYKGKKPESFLTNEGKSELRGFVPEGKEPGWLVPENLRGRWTLILGGSKNELPKLVANLKKIDIFYHDSEHSYENMKFEYETIWPKIPAGSFLISDDITWNNAFKEFVGKTNQKLHYQYRNLGIILK